MRFPSQASIKHLKALIATGNDNQGAHLVWLAKNGDVHLTCMDPEEPIVLGPYEAFVCVYVHDTLVRGGGWVGPEAAADPAWMAELHAQLTYRWKRYKSPPPEWPLRILRKDPV